MWGKGGEERGEEVSEEESMNKWDALDGEGREIVRAWKEIS